MCRPAASFDSTTEEVIFRGLLVHQFELIGAPLWFSLLVGAVVNAVNHAYQGRWLAPYHLAFYAATVALLYSPLGLMGSIGITSQGLVPLVTYRAHLRAYRQMRRAARSRANGPRLGAGCSH